MVSRKDKYRKNSKWSAKLLIGVLLLSSIAVGNVSVAFAGEDISSLLTNWFNQKGAQSVTTIEQAINQEKELQKQRLREELQLKISESAKEIDQFTENQKQSKVQSLKAYGDQLISKMNIDSTGEKQEISAKMDSIVQQAIEEMQQVGSRKLENQDKPKDPQQ